MDSHDARFGAILDPPAVVEGGLFTLPPQFPVTVGKLLPRVAALYPRHGITYLDDAGSEHRQSYPELLDQAARVLGGLRATGLTPGTPVIFQLAELEDFITAFWACMLGGYVPVPVSISPTYETGHATLSKLVNAWQALGQPLVLSGVALIDRLDAFAAREGLAGFRVASMGDLRAHPAATDWHENDPDDLALLLLTSGSTGQPKAVRQTHHNLVRWTVSVAAACEFTPNDTSLNWMPLDHVGGLVMFHLRDLSVGCNQVHALTETVLRSPLVWLDWIERHRATITWAPNFAFGLVNQHADDIAAGRWDLSTMRFILNGGEAIVSRTARRFMELLIPHGLPPTAMRPAWGMSETCSGVTYSRSFRLETTSDDDAFVSVGTPIAGDVVRIVDANHVPVPEGRVGNLQIAGISVTPGYLNNPEANRESFTADGWFITGDLGIIRDGALTIVGRAKDVIIVNGANFYSHEIEAIAEEVDGVDVSFTAACGVQRPGDDAERLCIFFSPTAAAAGRMAELIRTLRSTIAQRAGLAPDFLVPLPRDEVPKTAIGKVQRALLKERFERGEFATTAPADETDPMPLLQRVWRRSDSPGGALPASATVLVFADRSGLGDRLIARLRDAGNVCVAVRAADDFVEAADTITINPAREQDYARLFSALSARGFDASHVIHAWSYEPIDPAHRAGAPDIAGATEGLSLLRMLRAWPAPRPGRQARRLVVVTSQMQADAGPVAYTRATILGIVHSIPHEYDWLNCAALDFDRIDPAVHVEAVLAEAAHDGGNGEVSVRDGVRHVPALIPLPDNPGVTAFTDGGFYVISGARGGIGQAITAHLRKRHDARLLLLGRSSIPATDATDDHVMHWAGDVSDAAAIRDAVRQAAEHFGRAPDGFLHLAGRYHETPLAEETDAAFLETIEAKLTGAWALHQVARAYPNCLFVNFSSLLSYFGALGTASYASANAALDAFARYQRSGGVRSIAIRWSLWVATGMGRTVNRDALRLRGYVAREPAENIALLEHAIRSAGVDALVGLDVRNRSIQSHLDPSVAASFAVEAGDRYVAPRTDTERALARLWQDLLDVDRVGIEDNFFDLGGRSLLAARMFAWIDKEMGHTLPLATLYKAPTVAALAQLMSSPAADNRPRGGSVATLHVMQPGGSHPPIFCIPGVGSDVIVFQDLAHHLGTDQPVYGLQARGLDGTPADGDCPSIERVAADFIHEIRTVQPNGPYNLAGHCFGGLIAWEVARQLRSADQPVALLALFDPVATNIFPDEIIQQDRVRYSILKFLRMSFADRLRYVWSKLTGIRRTMVVRQRLGQSIARARDMHQRYRIDRYSGDVMIFMAEDSHFKLSGDQDPRRYHEQFADGGARYTHVPGNHDTMLRGDGAVILAESVRPVLRSAQ